MQRDFHFGLFGLLALLPVVAAQPAIDGLQRFRAELATPLRDVALIELEEIERNLEMEATAAREGYASRRLDELKRVEDLLDESIDNLEGELHAVEARVDEVLARWDSDAEQEVFESTFEPLADRFWAAAEGLADQLQAFKERGAREHEAYFGTTFQQQFALRLGELARTRVAYVQRLDRIETELLNEARRLAEAAGTLTPAARARLLDEAGRRAVVTRPPDAAMAKVREAAAAIRREVVPAPGDLDTSLAAFSDDLASFRMSFLPDLDRRLRELVSLESYYR